MYFNRTYKSFFFLSIIFLFISTLYSEDIIYGKVNAINYGQDSKAVRAPKLFYPDNEAMDLKNGDLLESGCTILTFENQSVEITLLKNDNPFGYILLAENTDIEIKFIDNAYLTMNYGRLRLVINKDSGLIKLFSKTIQVDITGTDFGIESLIDPENNTNGYVICFDGELEMSSRVSDKNGKIKSRGKCEFFNGDLIFSDFFTKNDLDLWQNSFSVKSDYKPDGLNFVLETLKFEKQKKVTDEKKEVPVEKNDTTAVVKKEEIPVTNYADTALDNSDVTADKAIKGKSGFDKDGFLSTFLSFRFGGLGYDLQIENFRFQNLGIKFLFDPSIVLFDDKFEFGFYLNLNFFPYALYEPLANAGQPGWDMFGTINNNSRFANREWSFGSDQNLDAGRMVFDIFDDLLLKMKIIRYNKPGDKIYIIAGQDVSIDERLKFSLDDFNAQYFTSLQRKTSFLTRFDLGWFKGDVYAEDMMPKGLYGTNFMFSTPNKSFAFKYYFSYYMECYDTVQFTENADWLMPAQFNSSFILDTFNIPSFGLSLYLSGGVLAPFSNMLNENNATAVSSGLVFSFGTYIRGNFKNNEFNFYFEFVKDSYISKIGMYDVTYSINRAKYASMLENYMNSLSTRSLNDYFKDHYFGFRGRFNYNYLKHVNLDLSYQWGIAFGLITNDIPSIGPVPSPDVNDLHYYDRINFKITLDSLKKWKVNCGMYITWSMDEVINTAKNTVSSQNGLTFLAANLIFIGGDIRFNDGISIYLQGGVYPFAGITNFCFDAGITLKPYYFFMKKK